MSIIRLKPSREKSVNNRHPWVFSGAIRHVDGQPELGDVCDVVSSHGEFLARAAYSPNSQIAAQLLPSTA